ncbi:beta-1,6-N-acetylglucosaminyltransferase [Pantoea dispersa]|uniref:beta-1,6-N-acetylglucosaminyltransferase n=1 Tax=Pantoea dispersa TaxID=59814 RepID=UPI000FDAC8F5|nr:beta-1,6-N-acetylglucosaminyltransferase [Pantoea dispersa]RVU74609.1 core-2/I-branching enzyme [Pantoea dispersa]
MKKMFCILCHKVTNPLIYTVNYLSSFAENTILIHVDAKSPVENFQLFSASNVHFVQNRVQVTWGDYSQIASTLNTLSEALQFNFEYLFLISGDDLPCKNNQSMNELLFSIDNKNLVHFQDERNGYVNPTARVRYRYPQFFYIRNKTPFDKLKILAFKFFRFLYISDSFKRHSNKINGFYKGTNWFSLNYLTVKVVMDFIEANPWYCDLYRYSFCGDEVFFHTVIKHLNINDLYHDSVMLNDALRYIDWTSGPDYPRVLDEGDLEKIRGSDCIFSRKHAPDIDQTFFNDVLGD